jgi:tRNA splicing endonuclease
MNVGVNETREMGMLENPALRARKKEASVREHLVKNTHAKHSVPRSIKVYKNLQADGWRVESP